MNAYLEDLLNRAQSPISEDRPCGENARYDQRYDTAKTEIMKLTAGAATVDWKAVTASIDSLLSETTKDLTLAAYLALALLKEHQYPGLLVGLKIIDSFVEKWWETMFPPVSRFKARIQIFDWMDERLSALAAVIEASAEHADELRRCKEVLESLPNKIQSLSKEQVTGFSRIRTEINKWIERLPEQKPEEEKGEDTTADASSADGDENRREEATRAADETRPGTAASQKSASAAQVVLPPPVDEIGKIDDGIKAIVKIVKLIREIEPLSPIAYRLARVLKWDLVGSAPSAAADGTTRIPPPDQQVLTLLATQLSASNWVDLTQNAEHLFITSQIFFLDLQRYVSQGLSNQGAEESADVVKKETGRLLNRLPGLLDMSFASGLPFADNETRQWAADARKVAGGGPAIVEDEDDNAWLMVATKAAGKNMASALPLLTDAISEAKTVKSVMQRQYNVAKLFANNREYQWAMPLLESLYEKIDSVQLHQWDPEFCSDVWELMLKGYEASPTSLDIKEREMAHVLEIRKKIFEVNVARAAGATPRKTKE